MTGTYGAKHNAVIIGHLRGGGGRGVTPGTDTRAWRGICQHCSLILSLGCGDWIAFALSFAGKTRGNCSAAAIFQMELETSAVPVCERTGYVGEHVLAKWRQK